MSAQHPGWYTDPADATRQRWWDGQSWGSAVARSGVVSDDPLPVAAVSRTRRRLPVWAWVLIAAVLVIPVIVLSPFIVPVALAVLVTGIVALSRGTRTWLRLSSRKAAIGVVAGSAAVLLVTGSVTAAALPAAMRDQPATIAAPPSERILTVETATPTATPTPVMTTRDETVLESIAFDRVTADDPAMPSGQTAVSTPGQNGERTLVYRVHLVDGQETARELISDAVTTAPVAEVTSIGSYVAPPPPPPPPAEPANQCDSNYADACVPVASDVDCAGGSGNGPAYFSGVARVVGSDIYDLDRNGDGYACEP